MKSSLDFDLQRNISMAATTTSIVNGKKNPSSHNMSIFMLPFVAHGHITPFLELAKILTKRDIFIYFCSTPINLTTIKNNLSGDTSNYNTNNIQLVELHLPTLPNLPPHMHTAKGLAPDLIPTLAKAVKMTGPNLSKIWEELNPDLLILDMELRWSAKLGAHLNIPVVLFSVTSVAFNSFYHHMMSYHRIDNYPFPAIFLRENEIMALLKQRETAPKEEFEWEEEDIAEKMMPQCVGFVLVKSLEDIEKKYMDYYSEMTKKKIVPLGLLIRDASHDDESSEIIDWLDKKDKCSTVFASFGSECVLTKDEITEIAHGLELSGTNFIWFIRFPKGEELNVKEVLSDEFFERVKERGRILEGWAPQVRILGHSSVGAFMCHAGWSSVMESMQFGVPIIAMPIQYDQPYSARLMVENGVALEILRGSKGYVEREEVEKVVKDVVLGEIGESLRMNARELMKKVKLNGDKALDEAVEEMKKLCSK